LDDKHKFYKEQDQWDKKRAQEEDTGASIDPKARLDVKTMDDVKFGADQIRISLKEKYLGRAVGAKRGETSISYSSSYLTLGLSGVMLVVLVKFIDTRPNKFA